MQFDFDAPVERKGTDSVKVDGMKYYFGTDDLIPMWVADMDFTVPPCVTNAIIDRANHPVYGYTYVSDSFANAITGWLKRRHKWDVPNEWIIFSPGIVPALTLSVLAYSEPGDKVLLQSPVYPPFYSAIKSNNRIVVENVLIEDQGNYEIDFNDLEILLSKGVKLMFFCNPHNPVGKVFSNNGVYRVIELCAKYNVTLISDEIHSDIIYPDKKHVPLLMAGSSYQNIVVCMAPSKTFNLAGMSTAYLIIPDRKLRRKMVALLENIHVHYGNLFGLVALKAAYNGGEPWLKDLLNYLSKNIDYVEQFFKNEIPEIKPIRPEGTYMIWLDCRETGMNDIRLKRFFIEKAKVGMNPGPSFGTGGSGFFRLNAATRKITVEIALERILSAWRLQ